MLPCKVEDVDRPRPLGGAEGNAGDTVDAALRIERDGGPAQFLGNPLRQRLGVVGHGKVDVMGCPAQQRVTNVAAQEVRLYSCGGAMRT